jgi:hypothetical protein
MSDRFGEAVVYWTSRKVRWERGLAAGTAAQFEPGDRVRNLYELATVLWVEDGGRVWVLPDEVDSVGWRRPARPSPRLPYTLTRVPKDTPMAQESEQSKRYAAELEWLAWAQEGAR